MPKNEPYRAWATFSFTARSGRVNECDLFMATPGGLYLVELKGHPGRVVNNGSTWRFHSADRIRTITNPLNLTDLKSKELKSQLVWAAGKMAAARGVQIPRIRPAVFLTDPHLISELDDIQKINVYGREDADTGLDQIWTHLLGRAPQRESQRITPQFSQLLPELMRRIGISQSQAHLDFGDGWKLESRPLDAGPTWEDRLSRRDDIVREEGRVRIYLVDHTAPEAARRSVDRAARREYQVLQGINHRGIAEAVQIREHQGGPAILFRHRHDDLRLDSFLDVHAASPSLTPEVRLDMVRQLAEAVRYAHNRSLYHRALAARSVYVSARDDGSRPVLRITDWQTAARDFDTTTRRTIGNSPVDPGHLEDSTQPYLAPEFDMPHADPVDMDVFGLGAVSYLILTGQPPAADRSGLIDQIQTHGGLHPIGVADGLAGDLDGLVYQATRGETSDRLASADSFLSALDRIEQDIAAAEGAGPEDSWAGTDPLTVVPGQAVDGDADGTWLVERVLGTGATAKALLVARTVEDEDGEQARETRVFKVALDEGKAAQLGSEAQILERVGGGAIVRLLAGPRTLAGRTVLDLEFAGERSLRALLSAEGKLTYHQLAEFGDDLFRALKDLAGMAVRHRDVKPDNFGVLRRADRTWELKLFDFSHAAVSDRDVTTGTRGYLDPFLGTSRRPDFDDHAERYAAAVTLHEMASGQRPVWGDDATDPRTIANPPLYLAVELFEPALREGLTAFFTRALHPDVASRFDTLRLMEEAWREIFRSADAVAPASTQASDQADGDLDAATLEQRRDEAALNAQLDTALDAAGLSPRAVSVAASFQATTVGQLIDVHLYLIAKARGAGAVVRKELNRRHKQWTAALRSPGTAQGEKPEDAQATSTPAEGPGAWLRVDELAALLIPAGGRKNSRKTSVVRLTLGLSDPAAGDPAGLGSWPTQTEIARKLDLAQASVSRHHIDAIKRWIAEPRLDTVRNELATILAGAGRVMTVTELAAGLRARRGAADQAAGQDLVKTLAVVRAAVEAETFTANGQVEEHEPRMAVLRRGHRIIIALESLPGTDDPVPGELADYALALGARADLLAAREPLPGKAEVMRELRSVAPPEGMTPFADTRLAGLAAAVARDAVASPRLELYPRGLPLAEALRISQAAAGVRHDHGITIGDLLTRIQARFPDLDAYRPVPTYVVVEEALKEAGFPLDYDTGDQRFRPPESATSWRSSTGTVTGLAGIHVTSGAQTPADLVDAKLTTALQQGGFLALTMHLRYLPDTPRLLADAYPVVPVNVASMFLEEFRALAAEQGTDWGKVLRADEKLTRTGEMPGGLRSYVTRVFPRVTERLLASAAPARTVLFLHNAGPLARYFDEGGRDLLTRLQNSARRPADEPYGLWLLCPSENSKATPNLDGRTVEAIGGDAEWAVLGKPFLARLREAGLPRTG